MEDNLNKKFKCVLHGSFRKHMPEIERIHDVFTRAGIEVLAPEISGIKNTKSGFAFLESDMEKDPRMVELLYLQNLMRLGENGFSYFVNPEGYMGSSASYEFAIAQFVNERCYFMEELKDHPAYLRENSIWKPEDLASYILESNKLPEIKLKKDEKKLNMLWHKLMVPGATVAAGGIIEYDSPVYKKEKEVLLVKTHKWGGRYSVIGGRVLSRESINDAFKREIKEDTGLDAKIGEHIVTFEKIKNSGYYLPGINRIYIDNVAKVKSKKISLNDEAQDYVWTTAKDALSNINLEPNARYTLELYSKNYI